MEFQSGADKVQAEEHIRIAALGMALKSLGTSPFGSFDDKVIKRANEFEKYILDGNSSALIETYHKGLQMIMTANSLDQAKGMAHAVLVGEEYHGHELGDES